MRARLCWIACVLATMVADLAARQAPASIRGGATIGGHVTDASSAPVADYSVVVFPIDRSKWSATSRVLRLVQPTHDGSFEVTDLPPGEYWVAATGPIDGARARDDVSGDWLTPKTLEQLSFRATRVTLVERQRFMTVLRVIRR